MFLAGEVWMVMRIMDMVIQDRTVTNGNNNDNEEHYDSERMSDIEYHNQDSTIIKAVAS